MVLEFFRFVLSIMTYIQRDGLLIEHSDVNEVFKNFWKSVQQ